MLCFPCIVHAQTISYALFEGLSHIDPVYATTAAQIAIVNEVFEPLVINDQMGQVRGAQAKSWDISSDGKTYTFNLREGITWSDGEPVVAEDFVEAFRRLVNPENSLNPKPTYLINQILNVPEILDGELPPESIGVYAENDNTLIIQLNSPASYFLSILAYPGLVPVPRHIIKEQGENWTHQRPLVSNGQFVLESSDDSHWILKRRDNHWDMASFDSLVLKRFNTQTEVFRDVIKGDIDIALDIPAKREAYAQKGFLGKVDEMPISGVYYAVFNTLDARFADQEIRQSISMLIDRTFLANSLGSSDEFAAKTFTSPVIWVADPSIYPQWFSWDLNKRRQHVRGRLEQAGYSKENPLEITILTTSYAGLPSLATGIRSMLTIDEIHAEIEIVPGPELSRRVRDNHYELAIAQWYGDYTDPLTFLALLEENGPKNHSDWADNQYNLLLEKALSENNVQKRHSYYNQMERIIAEQVPVIPLVYPRINVITSSKIQSYNMIGYGLVSRDITISPE